MALPSLLIYNTEAEYLAHYEREYCRNKVFTFDGIRVYFKRGKFTHAFYESSNRDGIKDCFSQIRAQRMDWIKATLTNEKALLYKGWDNSKNKYNAKRRVCVVYEDFVVVIQLGLKRNGELKAEFVTCYQADNSINKIKRSPKWILRECQAEFKKKGR